MVDVDWFNETPPHPSTVSTEYLDEVATIIPTAESAIAEVMARIRQWTDRDEQQVRTLRRWVDWYYRARVYPQRRAAALAVIRSLRRLHLEGRMRDVTAQIERASVCGDYATCAKLITEQDVIAEALER